MSVMLELCLEEVKQQLKSLPKKQQQAELREIENHLHAMIEARQASGMLHGEAVSAAIRQFGCPHRVGRALSRTWHNHQGEHPLRALVAALAAIACQAAFFKLYDWGLPVIGDDHPIWPYTSATATLLTALPYTLLLTPIASGMVAHAIAPRRGWWAALTVYLTSIVLVFLTACDTTQPLRLLELWPCLLFLPGVQFGSWWSKRRILQKHARKAGSQIVVVPSS